MRFGLLAAGVAAFFAFSVSTASAVNYYGGLGLGLSQDGGWCDVDLGSCDESAFSWKVFGGVDSTPWLSTELGYVGFGELEDADPWKLETSSYYFAGIARWPITEQFSIFGKLGLHRTEKEQTGSRPLTSTTVLITTTTLSATDWLYGVGTEYVFGADGKGFGLRLEWERFAWNEAFANFQDTGSVDYFSVGALFKF